MMTSAWNGIRSLPCNILSVANLPLIITTNLTPRQMRSAQDVAHARIYSRVLEMCTPILLQGADRRKSISNGKRVLAKQILFPQKEVQPNGKTK